MHFKFKDKYSYEAGLIVDKAPALRRPQNRKEKVYITGRSGYLTWDDDPVYDETTHVIEGHFEPTPTMSLTQLRAWLTGRGNYIDSRQPQGFYEAEIMHELTLTEVAPDLYRFTFLIVLQPFFYLHTGKQTITITQQNAPITHQGTLSALPHLKVYGSGAVSVTCGTQTMNFTITQLYAELDCRRKIAWAGTKHVETTGDFFVLKPEDTISWTGNVTKILLRPNWRCL